MAVQNCDSKQLNFGIDRILSNDYSSASREKSSCPAVWANYTYLTNCDHNCPSNCANLAYVHQSDTGAIDHSPIASIVNNYRNHFNNIAKKSNIIRPVPVPALPITLVAERTNLNGRRKTWSRAVFSSLQRKGLEKRFAQQKYITKPDRRQLAESLMLTDAQVKVWFQNRRMKWRHTKENEMSGESPVNLTSSKDATRPLMNDSVQSADGVNSSDDEDIDVGSNE